MVFNVLGLTLSALGIILSFYVIVNKQNNSFREEINKKFEEVHHKCEEITSFSNEGFNKVTTQFANMALQVNTILEGDVRELRGRIDRLESGQDEWTKTLRERTHDLANKYNKLNFDIELIKRYSNYKEQ